MPAIWASVSPGWIRGSRRLAGFAAGLVEARHGVRRVPTSSSFAMMVGGLMSNRLGGGMSIFEFESVEF